MRRSIITTLTTLALLVAVPASILAQDHVIDEQAEPEFLYVLSGSSGEIDGQTLTLRGVPSVLYFSDRPARIAGHMGLEAFADAWDEGPDSFAVDPPNAALSILGPEAPDDVVLELVAIEAYGDSTVSIDFVVIDGTPPQGTFGPASLFVDLVCRCS